jgi:hypothetical protein
VHTSVPLSVREQNSHPPVLGNRKPSLAGRETCASVYDESAKRQVAELLLSFGGGAYETGYLNIAVRH